MNAVVYERDDEGNIVDPITCNTIPEERVIVIGEGSASTYTDIRTLIESAVASGKLENPFNRQQLCPAIVERMEESRYNDAILVRVIDSGRGPFEPGRSTVLEIDPFLKVGDVIIVTCRSMGDITLVNRVSLTYAGIDLHEFGMDSDVAIFCSGKMIPIVIDRENPPCGKYLADLKSFCEKYSRNNKIVDIIEEEDDDEIYSMLRTMAHYGIVISPGPTLIGMIPRQEVISPEYPLPSTGYSRSRVTESINLLPEEIPHSNGENTVISFDRHRERVGSDRSTRARESANVPPGEDRARESEHPSRDRARAREEARESEYSARGRHSLDSDAVPSTRDGTSSHPVPFGAPLPRRTPRVPIISHDISREGWTLLVQNEERIWSVSSGAPCTDRSDTFFWSWVKCHIDNIGSSGYNPRMSSIPVSVKKMMSHHLLRKVLTKQPLPPI